MPADWCIVSHREYLTFPWNAGWMCIVLNVKYFGQLFIHCLLLGVYFYDGKFGTFNP